MKKTKKLRKLTLDKETLRRLVVGGDDAQTVNGGGDSTVITQCRTLCTCVIDGCC